MANLTGKTIGQLALLTGITSDSLFAVELSGATYHIPYSGLSTGGGGSYEEVTYSELYSMFTGGTLTPGGYYLITDFQSIYDQPDFDENNNPIITGNSKTSVTEPLLVFATSSTTLSNQAFSPLYPKDKITYDITFTTTEISNSVAKGRITERIDEFNNRTDYDHRNILFKRYRLYTIRQGYTENGTVELLNDGTLLGTDTTFTGYSVGDIIFVNFSGLFYEITGITDNVTMNVTGETINATGGGSPFFLAIEETNGTDYFSYKRQNVKTNDFREYTTFGNAISNSFAVNNYVGDYCNNYQNGGNGFLLPNNLFLEGGYENNKIGNSSYNNTFGTDNSNNTFGNFCFNNVSTNDMDENIIGEYFNNNLINTNVTENIIGHYFENNSLLGENGGDFDKNVIDSYFRFNTIYSAFYQNEINYEFNNNLIGDLISLDNYQFYRNKIGYNFNNNEIRQNFYNNRVNTNFRDNNIYGDFEGNTVLNGFVGNTIFGQFRVNEIGNAYNNNRVYDDFNYNNTSYYFNNNLTSLNFSFNKIGDYFTNNNPINYTFFGFRDLSTISTRNYDSLRNALDGNVGAYIVGRELVMRVISVNRYFRIQFSQWTQGGNGGGFQYERQELDSNGNQIGGSIIFTKKNNGSEVDIIIPGVLELTRDSQGEIYNRVTDTPPFGGAWPGPGDTEWNSIFTVNTNGQEFIYNRIGFEFQSNIIGDRFGYNEIGNQFANNTIDTDFGYGGASDYGNVIGDRFRNNTIGRFFYSNHIETLFEGNVINENFEYNQIQNYFQNNTIDNGFENNRIGNYFVRNTIGVSFVSNTIGDYFGNFGGGSPGLSNQIFDNFQYNLIGNNFGNDGSNSDGGNIINNNFQNNVIGDDFYFNAVDEDFTNNKVGNQTFFNQISPSSSDNQIGNVFVSNTFGDGFTSNKIGNYFGFNQVGNGFTRNQVGDFCGNSGTGNTISQGFTDNQIGNYFGNDGTNTAGGVIITSAFTKNQILSTKVFNIDFTSATYVYDANMTKVIFDRQDGTPRLSFYDNFDVLNIVNINN